MSQGLQESFDELLEGVLVAERAGFSTYYTPDHFYTGQGVLEGGAYGEAWTAVAAVGARCQRIRVGGAVMCNLFRHPCLTANLAATVDRVTNGRLELGMGAGWLAEEYRRTGLPYPKPSVRIRMLEEALRIILPALEGKPVTLDGEFYSVRDFEVKPGAVQKPRPPLHIGGGGDKLLRVAARYADLISIVPPVPQGEIDLKVFARWGEDSFRERASYVQRVAEEEGRDPETIELGAMVFMLRVTDSPAETAEVAKGLAGMLQVDEAALRRSPFVLIGTPDDLVAALEERRDRWGASFCVLSRPEKETTERLGREVIPRV
jgi:probable F420-dependent oxidoreductase